MHIDYNFANELLCVLEVLYRSNIDFFALLPAWVPEPFSKWGAQMHVKKL